MGVLGQPRSRGRGTGGSAKDVLGVFDKKEAGAHPSVSRPQEAHNCLRDACVAAGFSSPGSFNPMRAGQMKTMLARLQEAGVGPTRVSRMLFETCARWGEFLMWAEAKYALKIKGENPNHAALAKYAGEAAEFWKGKAAPEAPKKAGKGVSFSKFS